MKWFHNLSIARKLSLAFTLTTLMTMLLGAFALLPLISADNELASMAGDQIQSIQHLGEVRAQLGELHTYELAQLTLLDKPGKVADYNKRMDGAIKVVREQLSGSAALSADEQERELHRKVASDFESYLDANGEMRSAVAKADGLLAQEIYDKKSRPARRKLFDDLKALVAYNGQQMDARIVEANAIHRSSVLAIIICVVLLTLIAAASAVVISRAVARHRCPIQSAAHLTFPVDKSAAN